jgi:hypothetical protein
LKLKTAASHYKVESSSGGHWFSAGNSLDDPEKSELQFPTTTTFLHPSKPTRWNLMMIIVTFGKEKRLESGSENQKTW